MSLHIGQLSPDVRQPYLEHLFQKYGRCFVYLKDGYGFAVYDSNADAARALRALRGRYVCGGRITVNWSKHQPGFSQGFRRSSRFAESSHRRTSRDGGENIRFRDYLAEKNQPASHDEGHDKNHPASHDESHEKNHAASHDENHDPDSARVKECDKLAEDAHDAGKSIGEGEASPMEVNRDEGGTVDARAIEHERWAEAGKGARGNADGFDSYEPYHGLSREKETKNVTKASYQDSHNHRHSSEKRRGHSDKCVDLSPDDKSSSPPTCYTCGSSGHIARYCPQGMDAKFKARRDGLNFREKMELRQRRFSPPSWRRPELHVHPVDRKRQKVQDGRKPDSDIKKRLPRSSNVHRESRRHEHNSEQGMKETHKRNRSEISRGSSLSSERSKHSRQDRIRGSSFDQTSSDSRFRSPQSRVRVHSPSCSAHSSSKSSQPTQPEGSRSNINPPVPFSTSAQPQHKPLPDVKNKNPDGLMNSPLQRKSDYGTALEIEHMNNMQEGKGSALNSKVSVPSFNFDNGANVAGYARGILDKGLAESDDNVASEVQIQDANQSILAKNGRSKSLKLTRKEVISALKHYRLETHKVDSLDQPVEKYFGAARLWPWEIIYYRRLKKGSISTENYAKRLEQNNEFGIVDQYVRSSSGWWEYH